ncbi:root phototropism protein 3-like [Chenopodium quinoa]|uniref:root phototropism protein 3-like n=1 Tax=Chenopodium quinoa TaxID=63459 RepID=UPI000B78F89B|nr:root phototropism protein 3-like [Chenopodium quinoa]
MKKKSLPVVQEKAAMLGRRSYVSADKHNRCIIVPSTVNMVAEAIERKDTNWFVRTKVPSDLVVQIGKKRKFHLHILPMISRSAYLNRIVFEKKNAGMSINNLHVELNNLPGGAEVFELIVKFCYGWKVELTANNAAPLYCAATFLEMVDDLEIGNLVSRTETFLSFIIFSSWKDTFQVLKTCETISSYARDLQIQRRCSEAIAWKVCTNPTAISLGNDESQCFNFWVENHTDFSYEKKIAENWWFEDVSSLRIDHFIEVVTFIRKKGVKPEVLGSCIAYWTAKWLSRISFGVRIPTHKSINHQVRRVIVESLIRIIPVEENSVPSNFMLHLLKLGLMMKIDASLLSNLEKRIASTLENCQPVDLLVKNYGESETLYDVKIVARIVDAYVSLAARNSASKVFVVARLVDGFLALIARDKTLPVDDFRTLAELFPKNVRYSDDNLYRAIDRYLKAHPNLSEEEKEGVCRAMEYHKLSQEAREHAMKNDRLPLNMNAQFMLLQQVNMVKSMVNEGSMYRRTSAQMIISKQSECFKVQKQMKIMKQEVESLKNELNKVQLCRVNIKKLARKL